MQYSFYDLYNYYLNNPQYPTGQGIESLAPISTQSIINQNAGGDRDDDKSISNGVYDGSKKALGLTYAITGIPGLIGRGIMEGLTNRGVFGNTGIMAQTFLGPSSMYGGYRNPFGGLLGDDGFGSGVTDLPGMNFGSKMDDPSFDEGDADSGDGPGSGYDGDSGLDSGSGTHSDPGD
jgi:hypothetical protein